MDKGRYLTRDGVQAEVTVYPKPGMSVYTVFGSLDGEPEFWTGSGKYRMDGQDHPRDLVENEDPKQ